MPVATISVGLCRNLRSPSVICIVEPLGSDGYYMILDVEEKNVTMYGHSERLKGRAGCLYKAGTKKETSEERSTPAVILPSSCRLYPILDVR